MSEEGESSAAAAANERNFSSSAEETDHQYLVKVNWKKTEQGRVLLFLCTSAP